MVIAKQIEVRNNIKKYFDLAYEGDHIIVSRKENRNVVIISEREYSRLSQTYRVGAYANAFASGSQPLKEAAFNNSHTVKDDNISKLQAISELGDNWNQNGASAFPPKLIDRVRGIIDELHIQPEIFPTALCTIQLEYDNSRRDHMEIEISEAETAEVFVSTYNRQEYFDNIAATADEINRTVGAFYG